MNRRSKHLVLYVVLLGVTATSAVAAAPATAATTAYTCAANTGPGKQFSDAHCLTAASGEGGFKHVSIAELVKTNATGSNEQTASSTTVAQPANVRGPLMSIDTEVSCATVGATVAIQNVTVGGEMIIEGVGVINYTGCTVVKPSGKSCTVKEGKFSTNILDFTTEKQGAAVLMSPTAPPEIASITIQNCVAPVTGLNKAWPLTGTVKLTPSGPTWNTTHAGITTDNTLKWGGSKAGLESSLTMKGESGAALTVT